MDRLFVYGTLRRAFRSIMHGVLAGDAAWVGEGRIRGELFEIDGYPGAVPSADPNTWVKGEVYEIADSTAVFRRLDRYEQCSENDHEPHEYKRVEVDVLLADGRTTRAWVYMYNRSTADRARIHSGDYTDFQPNPGPG